LRPSGQAIGTVRGAGDVARHLGHLHCGALVCAFSGSIQILILGRSWWESESASRVRRFSLHCGDISSQRTRLAVSLFQLDYHRILVATGGLRLPHPAVGDGCLVLPCSGALSVRHALSCPKPPRFLVGMGISIWLTPVLVKIRGTEDVDKNCRQSRWHRRHRHCAGTLDLSFPAIRPALIIGSALQSFSRSRINTSSITRPISFGPRESPRFEVRSCTAALVR